jgi:hypothetical protein
MSEDSASSIVSAVDRDRVVALLRADVEATIGRGHANAIVEAAAQQRQFAIGLSGYFERVVETVQQYFHDTFVDTTWPSCPLHPNHPLWYSDGWWRCERIDEPVARLGSLGAVDRGPSPRRRS